MTVVDELTPSGVPLRAGTQTFTAGRFNVGRFDRGEIRAHRVRFYSVPADLGLTLELGVEEAGVWARIPELRVSGEGIGVNEAMQAVMAAARDWLVYLRDEEPELAPDLEAQRRYVGLLDAPYGWFKHYRFSGA